MIEGTTISMGGTDYVVPALTIGQIRGLKDKINSLISVNPLAGAEGMDSFIDVVHAALSRNYPDMKRDDLLDLVDLRNAPQLAKAIVALSGLVPQGEPQAGNL